MWPMFQIMYVSPHERLEVVTRSHNGSYLVRRFVLSTSKVIISCLQFVINIMSQFQIKFPDN